MYPEEKLRKQVADLQAQLARADETADAKGNDKVSESIKARATRLWNFFKLTIEKWELLFRGQGGVCAICGGVNKDGRRLSTDHDWISAEVRGLLCVRCNTLLGKVERGNRGNKPWTLDELKAAVAYKENPPARAIFGEPHIGWPGNVTTKKHRKMLKRLAKEKRVT